MPGIEGLRAIAAMMVLVLHCAQITGALRELADPLRPFVLNLHAGVPVFFSLTAFLLYRPFAAAIILDRPRPRPSTYLARRARRILPAYWVVLLYVGVGAGVAQLGGGYTGTLPAGTLVRDLLLVHQYHPDTFLTGIVPAWSLSVEVAFYAALPGLAWIAAQAATNATTPAGRILAALVPAAVMGCMGIVGKVLAAVVSPAPPPVHATTDWGGVLERSLIGTADLFAYGLVLAVVRVAWEAGAFRVTARAQRWLSVATLLGAVSVMSREYEGWQRYAAESLMALVATCVIAVMVLPGPRASPLTRLLETRALVAVGIVSYSVYLWHYPLQTLFAQRGLVIGGGGAVGLAANAAVLAIATIALSAATYRWVEKPGMQWRAQRRPAAAPADLLRPGAVTGG